jgi:BCD family chlorophyll transporter-like MFS transporter
MVLSFPLLGFSLSRLANDSGDILGWLMALICFLFFGAGTLVSGGPFLGLVRDNVPKEKQGLAISIVQTVLIAFFPISAIALGYWLEEYSQSGFWQVIIVITVIAAFFWLVAIAGVEKRASNEAGSKIETVRFSFGKTFSKIWHDHRTRRFFGFLAIATVAAWAQDNVLEPFGAEVFDMSVGQTTRLNAYWQGMLVVVLVLTAIIRRKKRPEKQIGLTKAGLGLMVIGMIFIGFSSLAEQSQLLKPGLVIFGAGFGLFTFGGFSLIAVMTTDIEAGAYLSLWTVCILVSRGLGIGLGSFMRDIFIALTDSPSLSYALIFFLEAIGIAVGAFLLSRRDILGFARDAGRFNGEELPAIALDV